MWLPEVSGPDGVPVTVRVEPAVAKWDRIAFKLALTPALLLWIPRARAAVRREAQRGPLRGKWAVDVESDGGKKARIIAATREEALVVAEQVSAEVTARGQSAIADYR